MKCLGILHIGPINEFLKETLSGRFTTCKTGLQCFQTSETRIEWQLTEVMSSDSINAIQPVCD